MLKEDIQYSVCNDSNAKAYRGCDPGSHWLLNEPIRKFEVGERYEHIQHRINDQARSSYYGDYVVKSRRVTFGEWK